MREWERNNKTKLANLESLINWNSLIQEVTSFLIVKYFISISSFSNLILIKQENSLLLHWSPNLPIVYCYVCKSKTYKILKIISK